MQVIMVDLCYNPQGIGIVTPTAMVIVVVIVSITRHGL